jgi:hypothetical protein
MCEMSVWGRATVLSMAQPPTCPRKRHAGEGWRVVRDGQQRTAGRTRQRWRCIDPDGGFHRFVGAVARTRHAPEAVCWECDNQVEAHEGPVAGHEFEYLVREVAEALVSVGRGLTYTDAAKRARMKANAARSDASGVGVDDGETVSGGPVIDRTVVNGQTVAEWMGEFVPVVAKRHAETEWPETIVLDSTEYQDTNVRTGEQRQLFAVLAVWGYPSGDGKGRLWRFTAVPRDTADAWAEFLAELPGKPALVVCDRDLAIIGGVQRRWGKGKNVVPIHLCEHHMFARGVDALERDGVAYGDPLRELLNVAFQSLAGWDAFDAAVAADSRAVNGRRWVKHWRKRMRVQTARRASLPAHYANGAVEDPLKMVRQVIDRRKFAFRNRARMNLLLELVRLRVLRADSVRTYAEDIRAHLVAEGEERAPRYRQVYDTWGPRSDTKPRTRVYSLLGWSRVEGDRPDAHE